MHAFSYSFFRLISSFHKLFLLTYLKFIFKKHPLIIYKEKTYIPVNFIILYKIQFVKHWEKVLVFVDNFCYHISKIVIYQQICGKHLFLYLS